jgi:hypothetical protein
VALLLRQRIGASRPTLPNAPDEALASSSRRPSSTWATVISHQRAMDWAVSGTERPSRSARLRRLMARTTLAAEGLPFP